MVGDFPESDWKLFRQLHTVALERFCRRILAEVERVSALTTRSYHDRYLRVFKLIQKRNRELARAFDDPRRSRALQQLLAMYSIGLIEPAELARFSASTQETIRLLTAEER